MEVLNRVYGYRRLYFCPLKRISDLHRFDFSYEDLNYKPERYIEPVLEMETDKTLCKKILTDLSLLYYAVCGIVWHFLIVWRHIRKRYLMRDQFFVQRGKTAKLIHAGL